MKTLSRLQFDARERFLESRRVSYLLKTDKFASAWEAANTCERDRASNLTSVKELKEWMSGVSEKSFSYAELMHLGKTLCIYNYSRTPVDQLTTIIRNRLT